MKTYTYNQLSDSEIEALCRRPKMDFSSVFGQVQPILDDVESNGDQAIRKYTKKFDDVDPDPLVVDPNDIPINLSDEIISALDRAMRNISKFHQRQISEEIEVETQNGVVCRRVAKPIECVGVYIPGGTAPLPSTAMMLCIPAMIAGCKSMVLATPPDKDGNISESVVYVAQKTGVSKILKAGGAQAIAGMALGTESIPKVDKIFGPGNQYVTAAKMILQNSEAMVSIDMPAGPSEVLVIADETGRADYIAADLLAQCEHDPQARGALVTTSQELGQQVLAEIERQLNDLTTEDVARQSWEDKGDVVVVATLKEACACANDYAPEHLEVHTQDAKTLLPLWERSFLTWD